MLYKRDVGPIEAIYFDKQFSKKHLGDGTELKNKQNIR